MKRSGSLQLVSSIPFVLLIALLGAILAPALAGRVPSLNVWRAGDDLSPVMIYLCTDDLAYLAPVTVEVPGGDALRESVRLVVEWPCGGPFLSPFPPGSRLRFLDVDGLVAHVRVSAGAGAWEEGRWSRAREALAWTLTGFPEIKRVSLDTGSGGGEAEPRPPFVNHKGPAPWDGSMKLILWFAYKGTYLVPVTKFVPRSAFPHNSALQQLIAGPPEGGTLSRTIPKGTRLLAVSVERGTCTVDISPGSSQAQSSGRTGTEALSLQSMILTLTEFLDVQAVRVLVDGKAGATLGGHVILDTPMRRGEVNSVYPGAD